MNRPARVRDVQKPSGIELAFDTLRCEHSVQQHLSEWSPPRTCDHDCKPQQPGRAAVDHSHTSDRMALIGRCRDDLSRVLRIARPGFPDWQVERHGVRRHWWLTFGLSARWPVAEPRAVLQFSSRSDGCWTVADSNFQIRTPRFAGTVTRASVPFRFLRARPLADRSPMWSHLAARAPQSSFCARWDFVQGVGHSRCLSR